MTKKKAVKLPSKYMLYKSPKFPAHLLCGDCVEVMRAMLEAGFENQIHAVVTDPPYGINWLESKWDKYDRRSDEDKLEDTRDAHGDPLEGGQFHTLEVREDARPTDFAQAGRSFQEWCEEWGRLCFALLKPGGFILSFGGSRSHHRMVCGLEDAGFEIRDEVQWVYSTGMGRGHDVELKSAGVDLNDEERERMKDKNTALKPAHEPIALGRKPLPPDQSVITQMVEQNVGALEVGRTRFVEETPDGVVFRYPANVVTAEDAPVLGKATRFFYCPKPSKAERGGTIGGAKGEKVVKDIKAGKEIEAHPTCKPIRLMSWLVQLVTPTGGIVLDPFMGSGTTVLAAAPEGYRAIGIELDPRFARLAMRRLQELE